MTDPTEALAKWEVLNQKRLRLDYKRANYEQIARTDIDRREWASVMLNDCTEQMYYLYREMDELEAEFADSLHHAAEIVNGWALVMGWREW